MKRFFNWQVFLGIFLILISVIVYFGHYLIFKDSHHIFIYLIGDIGFVFIEVLLVTMVIHQLLHNREKAMLFKKLNMVIGAFFSEVGTELLNIFPSFNPNASEVADKLMVTNAWADKDFQRASRDLKCCDTSVDAKIGDLTKLKGLLVEKREFLLRLLENPNLLEHESFTDLLWAIFHLTEELVCRDNFQALPDSDYQHLSGDIKRAYCTLILEWLIYMKHLKKDYPYLFSLAARINPFNENASVEVK